MSSTAHHTAFRRGIVVESRAPAPRRQSRRGRHRHRRRATLLAKVCGVLAACGVAAGAAAAVIVWTAAPAASVQAPVVVTESGTIDGPAPEVAEPAGGAVPGVFRVAEPPAPR